MPYSFSPNIPIDTLVREKFSVLQAYHVGEFSDQGCYHLLGFRPPQQQFETLRQMDTEKHHWVVRSNEFMKAVKDGLIRWIPSTLEGSGTSNGILYWLPDDDDDEGRNVTMKNSPDRGDGPEKPPVKNPDQPTNPKMPLTSQQKRLQKTNMSLTATIIAQIRIGNSNPESIMTHLKQWGYVSRTMILNLINDILKLPAEERADLERVRTALAKNENYTKIKKAILDEKNRPKMGEE